MAHWLAMIGSARPRARRLRDHWHARLAPLELVRFETGDEAGCPIGAGDLVLLGASGWSRLVAAVEVVRAPERIPPADARRGKPWVVYGRPLAAVTDVSAGPAIAATGVPTSQGAACVPIGQDEFESGLRALREREGSRRGEAVEALA